MKIIQLNKADWFKYKELRLEALRQDPLAFGGVWAEEKLKIDEEWQNELNHMWFSVVNENIVGMIGLVQDKGSAGKHRAHLISFWIRPEYRGQGIGKSLVEHVQAIAPEKGIRKIYLHVTTTQEGAVNLYEKLGFYKVGLLKENTCQEGKCFDQYLMEWHKNVQSE